jgi:DSF synthase
MSNMHDAVGLCIPYSEPQSHYETEFEPATGTIWGYFNPRGAPCFSLALLKAIRAHDNALGVNGGKLHLGGEDHQVRYYVCGSRVPGIFNLGGDLGLFALLIKSRSREELTRYARMCIDSMYARIQNYYAPALVTISMVQGDALGGGLECALSSDVVIAEESAQMGLPEILFNLFPGMGACSLLTRRVGMRAAERLILSGRMMSAAELHEAGVIDVLAKDGEGKAVTQDWIRQNSKRHNGTQALFRARQVVHPITRQELDAVADLWVEAALRLEERDLRMMARLVRSQARRLEAIEPMATLAEPAAAIAV